MVERMDGEGKVVYLTFDNIATYKQMPYLVRGLVEAMPKLGFVTAESNLNGLRGGIFLNDLKRNGIDFNLQEEKDDLVYENRICLSYSNPCPMIDRSVFDFGIDALKFSRRKLLDSEGISALKEKYKIQEDDHVIVAGSFNHSDFKHFESYLSVFNDLENVKFLMVPRGDAYEYYGKMTRAGVKFDMDNSITGEKNVIMVNEKGVLDDIYSVSDSVILGNSYSTSPSVQNPLEPAFYGKKIVSGACKSSWNGLAYEGLKARGLVKIVRAADRALEEALEKRTPADEEAAKRAMEFIESQSGMESVYGRIVQKGIYGELTSSDIRVLNTFPSYEKLRKVFG